MLTVSMGDADEMLFDLDIRLVMRRLMWYTKQKAKGKCSMFQLRSYTPPDFSQAKFINAPDASFVRVERDGVAPENFHAMSIFPEYAKVNGKWLLAEESRMDCVAVLEAGRLVIREFRLLKAGDMVLTGRTENAEEGIETTDEPVTQEQVDAAKAAIIASVQPTIDDINTRMQNGESFENLIMEYGTDPGMLDQANLTNGYAVHMDSIVWDPAFTNAAFSIENIGGWSEPSLGSYGIYTAYYLHDIPAGPVELTEDLKNNLQAELLAQKEDELFSAKLNEWYEAAEITYSEELVPADTAAE